jgi:hypothetical protein
VETKKAKRTKKAKKPALFAFLALFALFVSLLRSNENSDFINVSRHQPFSSFLMFIRK